MDLPHRLTSSPARNAWRTPTPIEPACCRARLPTRIPCGSRGRVDCHPPWRSTPSTYPASLAQYVLPCIGAWRSPPVKTDTAAGRVPWVEARTGICPDWSGVSPRFRRMIGLVLIASTAAGAGTTPDDAVAGGDGEQARAGRTVVAQGKSGGGAARSLPGLRGPGLTLTRACASCCGGATAPLRKRLPRSPEGE
jgi:hypothetical protein